MNGGARRAAACGAVVLAVYGVGAAPVAAAGNGEALPRVLARVDPGDGCPRPSTKTPAATPWQQTRLGFAQAWEQSTGKGVTVAVVDTGVDLAGPPALRGRVDVAPGGDSGTDCVGHGTFVAGLVAGVPRSGTGFAGVAPGARILAVRATSRTGEATADGLAKGIEAAVKGGARVVCVPRALPKGSAALAAAVREAGARGALVVAPAYTRPETGEAPAAAYPAALPGVLAVAALTPGGTADVDKAPATAPDLAAPGQSVMSVGRGTGYYTGSGAEYAAALVAGTAALVDAAHPGLGPAGLTERLTRTAHHSPATRAFLGAGTVDPPAAVSAELATAPPAIGTVAPHVPAAPSGSGAHRALLVGGAATATVVLVALGAAAIPLGRRRGWRPGTRPAEEPGG